MNPSGSTTFSPPDTIRSPSTAGTVSAIILEDGTERKITPQGEPQVEMTERPTPLGPAVQRTYSWTTVQGYRLEYRITPDRQRCFHIVGRPDQRFADPIRLKRFWLLKTPENGMTVTREPSDWMLSSTDPEARRWGTLDRRLPTERELCRKALSAATTSYPVETKPKSTTRHGEDSATI